MSICAKISAAVAIDCDYPMVGGVYDELILINFDDIDSVTKNNTNPLIIEDITLAGVATGFKWEGKNNSIEPQTNLVKQRFGEVFDHQVDFKVFKVDPVTKQQIQKLAAGKVVAIVRNNHKNSTGNDVYEVYGIDAGLYVQELSRVLSDADTQGAFSIQLKSSEQAKEPNLPCSFFITDFATTKTAVEALY